jgi:chemotaxis protein CheY-P-specific phosphatase CheC
MFLFKIPGINTSSENISKHKIFHKALKEKDMHFVAGIQLKNQIIDSFIFLFQDEIVEVLLKER